MKRRAFTLSELLITMTVVAIISVLVAPAITNLMPDKNKARLLKYNVMLNNTINEILNDESLYHPHIGTSGAETVFMNDSGQVCVGLSCVEGDFANLVKTKLIDKLGDGSRWTVIDNEDGTYTFSIDMDENKKSKEYSSSDTKNINTFKLDVDPYGTVLPGDPLTDAFLKNPLKLNDRKKDIKKAKTFLNRGYYSNSDDDV